MIAIKGGKIFTMGQKGIIDGGVILVDGDKIISVGKKVTIPDGYEIIDAGGCFITPGLIDAHTHIGLEEEIYRVEGDDVNESVDPSTPQLRAVDGINFADIAFNDALRGGVTRTMSMPGSANILGGQAVFLKHLAHNPAEMIYRQPWGLKAALGENPKRVYAGQKKTPVTRMGSASLLREAFYRAAKALEGQEKESKDSKDNKDTWKQEPIIAVLKKEMPLLLHAHRADDILTALRIKDEFDFDLIIQHGTEAHLIPDELIKRHVPVCLGPLFTNRAKVEMKEVDFKNAGRLARLGIEFCLITDHPVIPIEHLRVCAALTVREGLSEDAALAALTSIPARMLRVDHELGTLEKNKKADLAVFDGHPFDYRSRVRFAMVDGMIWRNEG